MTIHWIAQSTFCPGDHGDNRLVLSEDAEFESRGESRWILERPTMCCHVDCSEQNQGQAIGGFSGRRTLCCSHWCPNSQ